MVRTEHLPIDVRGDGLIAGDGERARRQSGHVQRQIEPQFASTIRRADALMPDGATITGLSHGATVSTTVTVRVRVDRVTPSDTE